MPNMYCDHQKEHELAAQRAKENILSTAEVEKICAVFRVLADGTRMKIVQALLQGEMCVYHLAEVTDSTVSGVSHHLRILRDSNIVKAKRYGKNVEYSIADGHIRNIDETALRHLCCRVEE